MSGPVSHHHLIDPEKFTEQVRSLQQLYDHMGIVEVLGTIQGGDISEYPNGEQSNRKQEHIHPNLVSDQGPMDLIYLFLQLTSLHPIKIAIRMVGIVKISGVL